jgi:hypothetical protein
VFAVFRETTYEADKPMYESAEFQEFQRAHALRPGYEGTIVADVGDGRFLTVTLWDNASDMDAARDALGPVVGRLLNPMMTTPAKLLGTGKVVVNDLVDSATRSK